MNEVRWSESRLVGLRWLRLTGRRTEVFQRLGQLAAEEIHGVREAMPERKGLRAWAASEQGRPVVERLREASTSQYSEVAAELAALAQGAGADYDDLLLANLRGDVGVPDLTGCTDLVVRGKRTLVAHNEDGAPALDGAFMFVTLAIDDEPAVTVQWYPGFLPCNAHVVTSSGLAWGINHVQVQRPADAAGRHFVARYVQRAKDLDEALDILGRHRSAGGFTYNLGEVGTGRVAVVETAAGQAHCFEPDPDDSVHWHTNHLRRLPTELDLSVVQGAATDALGLRDESEARGRWLDAHLPSAEPPSVEWAMEVLATRGLPDGVRRFAAGGDPLMTLVSTVVDLEDQRITLRSATGEQEQLSLDDYLNRGRGGGH